jgi:hypothetical protein
MWQAPQIVSLPGSTSKGEPQREHMAPSMKEIALQHLAQSECASPTRARHETQSGGKSRFKTRTAARPIMAGTADGLISLCASMA